MLATSQLLAQTTDSLFFAPRDFNFVKSRDPWLTGTNTAGLTRYQATNISATELSLAHRRGGFVNYDESPNAWSASALVESFYRLSPSVVVYGKMNYDNFSGKEMTGSAFIDTSRKPFDLAEDSLTNAGKKHRDTYHLVGAIGWDIWKGISLGGKLDFTAANLAKYKDLRHKTKYMNLEASASVYAPLGKSLALGTGYTYRRNTESLIFSVYGTSDKVYNSFINYGPWIGEVERFSGEGLTSGSEETPLLDEYHTGNIQLSWDIIPNLMAYGAFSYGYRKGYYGRPSAYSIIYMQHNSHLVDYQFQLQWKHNDQAHHLDINYEEENLRNYSNTYRSQINSSGATYYEYYDRVKTANRNWRRLQLSYTAYLGIREEMPTWTLHAGIDRSWRKQTGYDYPFYRLQDLSWTEFSFRAERNIYLYKGILALNLGFAYTRGKGEPFIDGTFIPPSDKQNGVVQMEAFLYREYLYLTAPQYTISGGAKYSFRLPNTNLSTYVSIDVSHHKTNVHNAHLVGRDNFGAKLAIGCIF